MTDESAPQRSAPSELDEEEAVTKAKDMYPGERTVEEVTAWVDPAVLRGPDAVIAELDRAVAEEGRVVNAQIELARHVAPEKVDGYVQARQHFLDLRAAQEERERQRYEVIKLLSDPGVRAN